MNSRWAAPGLTLITLLAITGAAAQTAPSVQGYLARHAEPDTRRLLPPPPKAGSGRESDDRAIFAATRALVGQSRWRLATADADMSPGPALFACAIGAELNADNAPILTMLLRRTSVDARAVVDPPKDHYARPRPYLTAANAPAICVPKTDALAKSPSYPSGHATLSWAWGLILAELAPDRAIDVLMRARSIGESRIVCGVHYLSDVEQGRTNGSALVAALHGDPAFRADMDKARVEITTIRQISHTAPGDCTAQTEAAAHPPY